jgi:pre-mRNA-splicing factor SYF1
MKIPLGDTREMLRMKRSVQATYNTQVNFMSASMMALQASSATGGENKMSQLEESISGLDTLVSSSENNMPKKDSVMFVRGNEQKKDENKEIEVTKTSNPDEIDIDEEEGEEEENVKDVKGNEHAI